jgi:hypothetical protein
LRRDLPEGSSRRNLKLLKITEAIFVERQLRHVHALESPHLYSGVEPLRSAVDPVGIRISFSRTRRASIKSALPFGFCCGGCPPPPVYVPV